MLDLMVLTIQEMMDRETEFLLKSRPINFIFTLGAAVGFLVGFAIVYQVLFTDVSNHLPQYATLKAIGYSDGYLRRVVMEESLILSLLGYLPGAVLAWVPLCVRRQGDEPADEDDARIAGLLILVLTIVMCGFSGLARHAQAAPG